MATDEGQDREELAKYRELAKYCWDNVERLDQEKVKAAVKMLQEELKAVLPEVAEIIKKNRLGWAVGYHFGWGMTVRNLLRGKEFGEKYFEIENLDDYYIPLIEMAAGFGHPLR